MTDTTTELVYDYNVGDYWARVHRVGCKDARELPYPITTSVRSIRELVEEAASDFIFANEEQPWTNYVGEVSLAPCVHLPLEVKA